MTTTEQVASLAAEVREEIEELRARLSAEMRTDCHLLFPWEVDEVGQWVREGEGFPCDLVVEMVDGGGGGTPWKWWIDVDGIQPSQGVAESAFDAMRAAEAMCGAALAEATDAAWEDRR